MSEQRPPMSVQLPRVNVATVVTIGIPSLLFIGTVFGVLFNYVVSRTQLEDNQIAVHQELVNIEKRLNDQSDALHTLENRITRMEEINISVKERIEDALAALKIQATPKHQ